VLPSPIASFRRAGGSCDRSLTWRLRGKSFAFSLVYLPCCVCRIVLQVSRRVHPSKDPVRSGAQGRNEKRGLGFFQSIQCREPDCVNNTFFMNKKRDIKRPDFVRLSFVFAMFQYVLIFLVVLLPLNYSFAQASIGTTHFLTREPSDCTTCLDGCAQRSRLTIIWSCLVTTVICAWSAVHPNIAPRERFTKSAWRRIILLVWTIIAPEILPAWALRETIAASVVRDLYNKREGVIYHF